MLLRLVLSVAGIFAPLVLAAQASTPPSTASPFGLKMGTSKAELSRIGELRAESTPLFYTISAVPKPHSSFSSYMVVVSDSHGLCKVLGVGKTVATSGYGTELRREYDRLQKALESRYGKPKVYDHLSPGSIWDEPRDWMMGLHKKERSLIALWFEKDASLPADLAGITLQAQALSSSEGYLGLDYEFKNFKACQGEIEARRDEGL
jgi:hypothetical protein